ncbi:MAG: hypothetical protein V1738_04445 [Patescibacteria group bacterium]
MNRSDENVVDPSSVIDGYSIKLVQELNRLVCDYGIGDPQAAVRRYQIEEPSRVCVSATLTPHIGLLVSRQPGHVDLRNCLVHQFGPSFVIWENGITVAEVRALMAGLYVMFVVFGPNIEQGLGYLEPGDNQAECRYSVDEHFKLCGQLSVPVMNILTAEDLLAQFDRPEELQVFDSLMGRGVIRKCDLQFAEEREWLMTEVLSSLGISADEQRRLPPDQLEKVFRLINAQLDAVYEQKKS